MSKPANSNLLISIVLCTYNNADSLYKTLQDIAVNVVDSGLVELIVINNNSPDHTAQVVQDLQPTFKFPCRYYVESNQGLSHARNLGLAKAQGEYILFTDDDAIINNKWLSIYIDKIHKLNPDCIFSKIIVDWQGRKPEWFLSNYTPFFAAIDYGEQELQITDKQHEFYGKNFCIRQQLLHDFGGFDPRLGRCGHKLVAGEETIIYSKLIDSKAKVIYTPNAGVLHRLKEREFQFDNIKKMFVDSAYTTFNLSKLSNGKKLFNRPIYPLRDAFESLFASVTVFVKGAIVADNNLKRFAMLKVLKAKELLFVWIKNP
tara:strand:+ start:9953 stop:10900 length:948 start_codon:yes stop_codon:yes gene_type:complete